MVTQIRVLALLAALPFISAPGIRAGTWADDFSGSLLGTDWRGDREAFSLKDGALKGVSASPVAESPLRILEVGDGWSNYVARCRINVVTPNLLVCSKGALILRHSGDEGYAFALHAATQTIEVYRLSNREMLLSKNAPLELGRWYQVRAELRGETMSFFVDDQLVGTVQDSRSPAGAAGVAAQDVLETLFDEFSVSGPGVAGNGLEAGIADGQLILSWPAGMTDYTLKTAARLSPPTDWEPIEIAPSRENDRMILRLDIAQGTRFFRLDRTY